MVVEIEDLEAEKKAVEEAKVKTEKAELQHQANLEKLEAAHLSAQAAKKELERQEAQNQRATAAMEREGEKLKEAEQELADSKANLRRIRGIDAVPGEGPAEPTTSPQAGAVAVGKSAVVAALLATALIM